MNVKTHLADYHRVFRDERLHEVAPGLRAREVVALAVLRVPIVQVPVHDDVVVVPLVEEEAPGVVLVRPQL